MTLEQRTIDRIEKEFAPSDQVKVQALLKSYSGPEADRVVWDILELSKGKLESVSHYVEQAGLDYRDILYWAEYYANDPVARGRDAKKTVEKIVTKWGTKSERPDQEP